MRAKLGYDRERGREGGECERLVLEADTFEERLALYRLAVWIEDKGGRVQDAVTRLADLVDPPPRPFGGSDPPPEGARVAVLSREGNGDESKAVAPGGP